MIVGFGTLIAQLLAVVRNQVIHSSELERNDEFFPLSFYYFLFESYLSKIWSNLDFTRAVPWLLYAP